MPETKTIKDLPIYGDLFDNKSQALWITIESKEKGQLEKFVTSFRQGVCDFMQQFKHQKESATQYYQDTKDEIKKQANYISHETNVLPKLAFISLSGFSGLLIGYRRSTFRKIIYTTVLTTGAVAVCYPKEAKVYSNQAYVIAEQNAKKIYREYIWPEETKRPRKVEHVAPVAQVVNSKDKIVKLDSETIDASKPTKTITGDKGQASDEDKDMYTTRK